MKQYIFLFISILSCQLLTGQPKAAVHPGADGIYIFCGSELPKGFHYQISRKELNGDWQKIATLGFPRNKGDWQGRLTEASLKNFNSRLPDSVSVEFGWGKLKLGDTVDSLYYLSANPVFQIAAGVGFWDITAKRGVKYQYQIGKTGRQAAASGDYTLLQGTYNWPGNPSAISIAPDTILTGSQSVMINWRLANFGKMAGCRVFRTYYLKEEPFIEIRPDITYFVEDSKQYLSMEDKTVTDGQQYSYFIIPYDFYGNQAHSSDTIHVYNKMINTARSFVLDFKGKSMEEENKIRLSWKITRGEPLASIDIYKSLDYNGNYFRVSSVSPTDTLFDDFNVQPVTPYYYTLVLNTPFGRTFPSATLPVVFKANRKTSFPPQNLTAKRTGGLVHLQWTNPYSDVRAFYVYRMGSYSGNMTPIGQVVSSDTLVTYTDTVANLPSSPVWSYAVASENTSYAISPLSARVNVPGNEKNLPIPAIQNIFVTKGNVEIFWNDPEDVPGRGFLIKRREADEEYRPLSSSVEKTFQTSSTLINSFTDTTAEPDHYYSYVVQFLGVNEGDSSSPSLPAGAFIPLDTPLPPNNVTAVQQKGNVLLQWELPLGVDFDEIHVYRATAGTELTLLKTLKKDEVSFLDNSVKKGVDYFYWVATVRAGLEGRTDDPVGIKVN